MTPARFKSIILSQSLNEGQLTNAREFFEQYDFQEGVGPTAELTYLGDPHQRVCRYCGRREPEVTFKSLAHLLPDFMGNRHMATYFECDNCNNWFSKYETTFANYFGISRTISQILGKRGTVPGYQDDKQDFNFSVGKKAMQLAYTTGKKPFTIDKENKQLTIHTTRPGYVPLHLIKLLWKVGLALLPEVEVVDFEWVRELLLSNVRDHEVKGDKRLQVSIQFIPGPPMYRAPYAQLFTRRTRHSVPVQEKQVVLYYANYVIQAAMPSRLDFPRLFSKLVHMPIFPNIAPLEHQAKYGTAQHSVIDCSDATKVKKQPHDVSFRVGQFTKLPLTARGTVWTRRRPKVSTEE